MADFLKTFIEGEDILASDANSNNQFLLSKLSDNAAQVQNYVEGEVAAIKSNVASVQATLQGDIDEANAKINKIYPGLAPNYSAGVSVTSGYEAEQDGWIYYYITSSANFTTRLLIDEKVAAYNYQGSGDQRAGTLRIGGMVFIAKGQKVTLSRTGDGNTLTFYPCIGFVEEEEE